VPLIPLPLEEAVGLRRSSFCLLVPRGGPSSRHGGMACDLGAAWSLTRFTPAWQEGSQEPSGRFSLVVSGGRPESPLPVVDGDIARIDRRPGWAALSRLAA
jgi:hypothetical protein